MTDLDVALGQSVPIAAGVSTPAPVAATVGSATSIVAAVDALPSQEVAVGSAVALAATVGNSTAISVSISEALPLAAEIDMAILTGEDRAKLDSIEWGAQRNRPDIVRLAYAVEKSTGGGGESGGGTGDSTQWTGTQTYQETIDIFVPTPSWRSNGYIEFDFTAAFLNEGADGTQTVSFQLQRAYPPPTTRDTIPSLYGLPTAFAAVSGAEWTSLTIPPGVGTGTFTFVVRVRATGHLGASSKHVFSGQMICSDLSGATPVVITTVVGRLATSGASPPYLGLDVTEDLEIRAMFKMGATFAPGAGSAFNVTSASAIFVPRSDHPFN